MHTYKQQQIQCVDVILEEPDIAKAITEYVSYTAIDNLVLGASSRYGFIRRLKFSDVPGQVSKGSPDFCTIYVINKGKISSLKNASRSAPVSSPLLAQIQERTTTNNNSFQSDARPRRSLSMKGLFVATGRDDSAFPLLAHNRSSPRGRGLNARIGEAYEYDNDISFVSSGRPSGDQMSSMFYDSMDTGRNSQMSISSDRSAGSSIRFGGRESDLSSLHSQSSFDSDRTSVSSYSTTDDAEAEMRRLKLELQKTMDMYSTACKEALSAKQKAVELQRWRMEEEARIAEESEMDSIGEGGYGPVFKCRLDHTPVAVKVLRPDATEGQSQFHREVEVLSCMRHPNMVLLIGACPEIAAEIATGLHFLHQTKPEPLVHRDLKPANILLDQNYVSKISDIGLTRLVPPSVEDKVTQYRMTSTAGTFCYIDPEYQQTGMLGVKSDVYSFGIVLLQILTAKPAMDMLDPSIPDWPVEEALCISKLAVQCTELRQKDRPDLGKDVLPELNRSRDLADEEMMGI
ncbi:Protein kinase domain-containing protein [Heracleum sosnowskyi]|uniref:RING-type E3 ubiquitin transferase n=1 Tax=Heracleum sosnowskyi TaxID=360622 RepID=A0AAD8JJT9_9APIA|nr:Protein kinase domain-containing protein [Heracleum sosnowskyi]